MFESFKRAAEQRREDNEKRELVSEARRILAEMSCIDPEAWTSFYWEGGDVFTAQGPSGTVWTTSWMFGRGHPDSYPSFRIYTKPASLSIATSWTRCLSAKVEITEFTPIWQKIEQVARVRAEKAKQAKFEADAKMSAMRDLCKNLRDLTTWRRSGSAFVAETAKGAAVSLLIENGAPRVSIDGEVVTLDTKLATELHQVVTKSVETRERDQHREQLRASTDAAKFLDKF